ncbi:MAG: hypothetical protein U0270_06745 [Labilithrix sp.]
MAFLRSFAVALLFATNALAQEPPPSPEPLPPPPPPPMQPSPPAPAPAPYQPPPAAIVHVQAPPVAVAEDHAPKYSLWVGIRASAQAFGFSFYENEQNQPETTGNFITNGIAPQIDVGARISYRYIPFIFWEHGFVGAGHRFAGGDARAATEFYGLGFRYLSGDVDSVAFLTDLSIGKRVIRVSNGSQEYEMSGLEFFRLGLGAEIRVKTLFALTPVASISSGALNDSTGNITFACENGPCRDGITRPRYTDGQVIDGSRAYVVLNLGLGIHFDVFGK